MTVAKTLGIFTLHHDADGNVSETRPPEHRNSRRLTSRTMHAGSCRVKLAATVFKCNVCVSAPRSVLLAFACCALAQLQPLAPWPKHEQNIVNSGLGSTGGCNGLIKWGLKSNVNFPNVSPLVGADGTIYIGCNQGLLFAINPNGTQKWTSDPGFGYYCTPAIGSDGTIYGSSFDYEVFAVDSSGNLKWKLGVEDQLDASDMTIGPDGTLYVCGENHLYAVNAGGTLKWESAYFGTTLPSGPALGPDGSIYVATSDGLMAFDSGGNLTWTFGVPNSAYLTGCASVASDGTIYYDYPDGTLYAINPDGTQDWAFALSWGSDCSPSIGADGTIYVLTATCDLFAINPDGSQKWMRTLGGGTDASNCSLAIGSDGTIYAPSNGGSLYAVNPDGTPQWTYTFTVGFYGESPAIDANGTIYLLTGGATGDILAIGNQSLAVPVSGLTLNPPTVLGGGSTTGQVSLSSAAPAGGDLVMLSSSDPTVKTPPFVLVPAASQTAIFTISTQPVNSLKTVTIKATSGGTSLTATLTVSPAILTLSPATVTGGTPVTGTLQMDSPARAGGLNVTITSNSTSVTVPGTVAIPAGQTSQTFTVQTSPVSTNTAVSVTADFGTVSSTAALTLLAPVPAGLTLSPISVTGGTALTGTLTLTGAAPSAGSVVSLTSSSASASVPATVTVPSGAASANFIVTTAAVAKVALATITAANLGTPATAQLTINPAAFVNFTLNPSSVPAGLPSTGTLTLSGPAPSGGLTVTLGSSSTSASVPGTVTIAAGLASATFTISTFGVAATVQATISAKLGGTTLTATLTINPASLASITLNPSSVTGGAFSNGTVTLTAPSASGGTVVSLRSNSANAVVPASVMVPGGSISAGFSVSTLPVSSTVDAVISGSANGGYATATLAINPPTVQSLSVRPSTVIGGNTSTGTVALTGAAGPGGAVVNLASNASFVQVPASVTVPPGALSAIFTVSTGGVVVTTSGSITATYNGSSQTATLTVQPAALANLTIQPGIVGGGASATGTLTLNGLAPPGGLTAALASSSSVASVPRSVTVAAGASTATFPISTSVVTASSTVTITATSNLVAAPASFTVQPASLLSVSLSPTAAIGGSQTTVTGTVALNGLAPARGHHGQTEQFQSIRPDGPRHCQDRQGVGNRDLCRHSQAGEGDNRGDSLSQVRFDYDHGDDYAPAVPAHRPDFESGDRHRRLHGDGDPLVECGAGQGNGRFNRPFLQRQGRSGSGQRDLRSSDVRNIHG